MLVVTLTVDAPMDPGVTPKRDDERVVINAGDDGTALNVTFPVRPKLVRVRLEDVELLATIVELRKPADVIEKSGVTTMVNDVVCVMLPKVSVTVRV